MKQEMLGFSLVAKRKAALNMDDIDLTEVKLRLETYQTMHFVMSKCLIVRHSMMKYIQAVVDNHSF